MRMTHYNKFANKFGLIIITALLIPIIPLVLCGPVFSGENANSSGNKQLMSDRAEKHTTAFTYPVRFFGKYISGADSDRCPMHPTCSGYCINAVKKHGPVKGWIMTCDRLLRCGGDEIRTARPVRTHNDLHFHDPVENNDFWWK